METNQLWNIAHRIYSIQYSHYARILELLNFAVDSNEVLAKANIDLLTELHHHGLGGAAHDNAVIGRYCHIFQNVMISSK